MYIPPKKQLEMIDTVKGLTSDFKHHWDKVYTGQFADYRKLSNGELPTDLESKLKGDDYLYHSKLIPRVIPVANEYLKTSIINALFNREKIFDFVGRVQESDHSRAEHAYNLVSYAMDVTDAEDVCEQIVEDALEVGGGVGEIVQYRETIRSPQYTGEGLFQSFNPNNEELIYFGPKLKYRRPEMVYFDNQRSVDSLSAFAVLTSVPISSLKKECGVGGLYANYAANVKKIKADDYDANAVEEYDVQNDHSDAGRSIRPRDFQVLQNQFWMSMTYEKEEVETWYLISIANYNNNPQLIRFERDPMGTGRHPLIFCRVYPKNNRLYGESVPEKLQNYMLEKFHKRNQRINLVNLAHDLAGCLLTNQGVINKDSIYVKRNKVVKITGNPKEIQNIPLDLTPLATSINEEMIIDKEVQEEIGTNPIALGTAPMRREAATTTNAVDENSRARANRPIRAIERTLIRPLAKGFLLHCQLYMPDDIKLRVLGPEGQFAFQTINKRDILGVFDVRCRASSELLTKGIKQALLNNLAQVYLNSSVRMDKQEFARQHFKVSEFPNTDRVIDATSDEQLDAERENGALLNGVPWKVLEHDDHERHLQAHTQALMEAQGKLNTSTLELHIQMHTQVMQMLNGQVNLGKELPNDTLRGDFLDTMNSNMTPTIQ